jgi:hypothetical protein
MPRASPSSRPSHPVVHRSVPRLPPPPPRVSLPTPPPTVIQTERPGFLQSVKEGFSLGVGVNLANRMVGAVLGPPGGGSQAFPAAQPAPQNSGVASAPPAPLCHKEQFAFDSCVRSFPSEIMTCQSQMDSLNACLATSNRNGSS